MKKIISMIIVLIIFCLSSCSLKPVKEDLTIYDLIDVYKESPYLTWSHIVDLEDNSIYKYQSELKVYNPDNESRDYIFIYFFENYSKAQSFVNDRSSKSCAVWFFSLIFGEETKPNYEQYDYIVVESYKSNSAPSRNDMIKIFENKIYE